MARLNCVVRGVGESPFRGGAAPEGRGPTGQEGGEPDGRELGDAADRGENLPPARCARVARRPSERRGLHQRSTCCEPRRQEGRRLISFYTLFDGTSGSELDATGDLCAQVRRLERKMSKRQELEIF